VVCAFRASERTTLKWMVDFWAGVPLNEGLKPALNMEKGGDLALNLKGLYGYCVVLLTQAILNNDAQSHYLAEPWLMHCEQNLEGQRQYLH